MFWIATFSVDECFCCEQTREVKIAKRNICRQIEKLSARETLWWIWAPKFTSVVLLWQTIPYIQIYMHIYVHTSTFVPMYITNFCSFSSWKVKYAVSFENQMYYSMHLLFSSLRSCLKHFHWTGQLLVTDLGWSLTSAGYWPRLAHKPAISPATNNRHSAEINNITKIVNCIRNDILSIAVKITSISG